MREHAVVRTVITCYVSVLLLNSNDHVADQSEVVVMYVLEVTTSLQGLTMCRLEMRRGASADLGMIVWLWVYTSGLWLGNLHA